MSKPNKKKMEKVANMVYEDVKDFLLHDTDHWGKEKGSGAFASYGLLNAVFETLFFMAPSKKSAMQVIFMSLMNFVEPDDLELMNFNSPEEEGGYHA